MKVQLFPLDESSYTPYDSNTNENFQDYNRTTEHVLVVLDAKINTIEYNCLLFRIQISDVNDLQLFWVQISDVISTTIVHLIITHDYKS